MYCLISFELIQNAINDIKTKFRSVSFNVHDKLNIKFFSEISVTGIFSWVQASKN
jgi:hypothetical protein